MRKPIFLAKLKEEGKLKLVRPSEEVSESYLTKAENSLKSAKLLSKNNLNEDSISMSYYAMYNALTSLLFRIVIKCDNHSGSIVLFKKLLRRKDLFKIISTAKKERIDKQYYVRSKKNTVSTKRKAKKLVRKAEDFLIEIKLILNSIKREEIKDLREKFESLF